MENAELVKRLIDSDIGAFNEVYHKYLNRLFGFVLKIIKQESDAEEIVQEVFVKVWSSRHKINDYDSFESFLFTIAYNNTISLLRKRMSEQKYLTHLQSQVTSGNVVDELHFKELNECYQKVIEQLTPRQKEIYLLSREDGLTYNEIAAKLGLSKNTVEIHMTKALSFIKRRLGKTLLINVFFIDLFIF